MTITCFVLDASSGTPAYAAKVVRQALSALLYNGTSRPLGAQSGAGFGHSPAISASSTTWSCPAFAAVVDAAFTSTQSPYFVASDATVTGSMTTADATNPRLDIIYVQVSDDPIDSSGARSATVGYLAGTAAGSPTQPTLPARSALLGVISVPHTGGGSPSVTATRPYSVAAGGILPVANATDRDAKITNPVEGMYVDDLSLNVLFRYSGSAWVAYPFVRARGFVNSVSTNVNGIVLVTHGLGSTPVNVQITPFAALSANRILMRVVAVDATSISVLVDVNEAVAVSAAGVSFYWTAEL